MFALSKYLYIVDDLKWSFIDAILNNELKNQYFGLLNIMNRGIIMIPGNFYG